MKTRRRTVDVACKDVNTISVSNRPKEIDELKNFCLSDVAVGSRQFPQIARSTCRKKANLLEGTSHFNRRDSTPFSFYPLPERNARNRKKKKVERTARETTNFYSESGRVPNKMKRLLCFLTKRLAGQAWSTISFIFIHIVCETMLLD